MNDDILVSTESISAILLLKEYEVLTIDMKTLKYLSKKYRYFDIVDSNKWISHGILKIKVSK